MGKLAFWISWPLLYIYLGWGERTRVLVVADDHVLMVRTWLGPGRWILPGGGLHHKEAPAVGALRELREETGVALDQIQLQAVGLHTAHDTGIKFQYHGFVARLPQRPLIKKQLLEIAEVAWVPVDQVLADNPVQSVRHLVALWKDRA